MGETPLDQLLACYTMAVTAAVLAALALITTMDVFLFSRRVRTMGKQNLFYTPRGDYVLLRLKTVTRLVTGVEVPEDSLEAKQWYVVKAGPEVKDLKHNDRVLLVGKLGEDVARLPGEDDLFISKQANLITLVKEKE